MTYRNRRIGRTTRTLWRALLHASENDRSHVVVLAGSHSHAKWISDYLRELVRPVGGCTLQAGRRLTLPNGSRIEVMPREGAADRLRGVSAVVFHDHWYPVLAASRDPNAAQSERKTPDAPEPPPARAFMKPEP